MADLELVRCPACGATNRVPRGSPGTATGGGRGKAALPIARWPVVVTGAAFAAEVEQAQKGGHEVERIIGVLPKAEIGRQLEKVMP
jgi:hypothetical protein